MEVYWWHIFRTGSCAREGQRARRLHEIHQGVRFPSLTMWLHGSWRLTGLGSLMHLSLIHVLMVTHRAIPMLLCNFKCIYTGWWNYLIYHVQKFPYLPFSHLLSTDHAAFTNNSLASLPGNHCGWTCGCWTASAAFRIGICALCLASESGAFIPEMSGRWTDQSTATLAR